MPAGSFEASLKFRWQGDSQKFEVGCCAGKLAPAPRLSYFISF
jgi:hypothetical protein